MGMNARSFWLKKRDIHSPPVNLMPLIMWFLAFSIAALSLQALFQGFPK
jgi:hypothetical protein